MWNSASRARSSIPVHSCHGPSFPVFNIYSFAVSRNESAHEAAALRKEDIGPHQVEELELCESVKCVGDSALKPTELDDDSDAADSEEANGPCMLGYFDVENQCSSDSLSPSMLMEVPCLL